MTNTHDFNVISTGNQPETKLISAANKIFQIHIDLIST